MKKVCIIANAGKEAAGKLADRLPAFFHEHGIESSVCWEDFSEQFSYEDAVSENTDCVIVLGGDGTMIRAAAKLAGRRLPVFGINLGHLGFLASAEQNGAEEALLQLLSGQYSIEERMMLEVWVNGARFDTALNDVVVSRSGISRIIEISVWVNENRVFQYRGDGVIVATPTGSTGYNLSAGGPVVVPTTQATLVTPICPHSLSARGIVISSGDLVRLGIGESQNVVKEEAIVTVDGWNSVRLTEGDRLEIRKAEEKAYFIRLNDRSFFDLLHKKLENQG